MKLHAHQPIPTALRQLQDLTGLTVVQVDGDTTEVTVKFQEVAGPYRFYYQPWINQTDRRRLLEQAAQSPMPTVLVADYINPRLAERLKQDELQFLDTVGNAWICQLPLFIDIQGKKLDKVRAELIELQQAGKAFQPKGMKIGLQLLMNPELAGQSLRIIAQDAEVSLGTTKQVVDDLIRQQVIAARQAKGRALINWTDLLQKWIAHYQAAFEAKMTHKVFVSHSFEQLQQMPLTPFDACWGGEVAAAKYTRHLKAKDALIYVPADKEHELIKTARLRKPSFDETPQHKVLLAQSPFTNNPAHTESQELAHPVLVYAHLMNSQDARNRETAEILYEQYLSRYQREATSGVN